MTTNQTYVPHLEKIVSGVLVCPLRLGHSGLDTVLRLPHDEALGMDLNISSLTGHRDTYLDTKQWNSHKTKRLTKCSEDHTVHCNMVGPVHPLTFGKSRYVAIFIVIRSRFANVYTISQRSEVLGCLIEFIACPERTSGVAVRHFHSDQAEEYLPLGTYLSQKDIVQTLSSA